MASSIWLNLPVIGFGEWPESEQSVWIDSKEFTLCPLKKTYQASIHIDLQREKIPLRDAITLINSFLSHLSWCSGQAYWTSSGFSGGVVKSANFEREQRMLFSGCLGGFPDYFELSSEPIVRNALAFYRHGKIAERYSLADACLSYYKILEIVKKIDGWQKLDRFINLELDYISSMNHTSMEFLENKSQAMEMSLSKYLFKEIRNQAAHYFENSAVNLDDERENEIFKYAVSPMHDLAHRLIQDKLNTQDHIYEFAYQKNSKKFFENERDQTSE